jgi:hypothetical protein
MYDELSIVFGRPSPCPPFSKFLVPPLKREDMLEEKLIMNKRE